MRVYLVEDEKPALNRLIDMLSVYEDVEIIGSGGNAKTAVAEIEKFRPDAVFLDIHLEDISGIDLPALLTYKPQIVFCTAFDQYAVQAFELQAVDFLLKPFSAERLESTVIRLRERMAQAQSGADELVKLLQNWKPSTEYLIRIPSKIGDRIFILNANEIVYFNSENKLVFAHLASEKFLINFTLEQLNKRLDPEMFFRIHRSTIVNLEYVKTIEAWFAGGYRMTVNDKTKTTLEISRNAGRQLRQKLGW